MSLFRRDIVSITRVALPTTGGILDPKDFNTVSGDTIYSGLKADIQYKSMTTKPNAHLPLDVDQGIDTIVFLSAPNGTIKENDMIVDALGRRFQVFYAYYTFFGYQCYCKKEQM